MLVVDDRDTVRDLFTLLIETDERLTLAATAVDGAQAVEHVEGGCPDAVILDVRMPRMNGLEALPILRAACAETVIVVYSSDPDSARTAVKLGANAVLDKSTDPIAVLELLADLCTSR